MSTFKEFALLPSLEVGLAEKKLVKPTDIQRRVLPPMLQGKSVVAVSETGSGKTVAFVLPVLQHLKTLEDDGQAITDNGRPRAAIVVPTRDLGEQVTRVFKMFTHTTRLRVRSLLGGTKLEVAKENVSGKFEVLVATPGRLIKLLDRKLVDLSDVRVLVFDEADQMVDKSFLQDAKRINSECPDGGQRALFSATISPVVQDLITQVFADAQVIRSGGKVSTLTTENRKVVDGERLPLLRAVLGKQVTGGTLIFTNTREQCDKVAAEVRKLGHTCAVYRGEMDKVERRNNLKAFRSGEVQVLISTDLASRGLDIDHIGRVVNYHLPKQIENYMHRAGRTARAGRPGMVINFVTERDLALMKQLG